MAEFYGYRLQHQDINGIMLLQVGRLRQQYIVDVYAAVEQNRLRYLRLDQKKLLVNLYQGLQDAIVAGDNSAAAIRQKIILASSFARSPRHMVQNYQDAMAICRWACCLDVFVTFTCNPQWPEIKRVLLLEQPQDRSDLVTQVFKINSMTFTSIFWDTRLRESMSFSFKSVGYCMHTFSSSLSKIASHTQSRM